MEMLDLANDDPDEYSGKGIVIDGCAYELGPELGSGLSKFVHTIKNVQSGLTLSVIAIYRSASEAEGEVIREVAAKATADLLGMQDMVLNIMRIEVEGAVAHFQDYLGPYESEQSPAHEGMSAGDALAEQGKWQEAVDAYRGVLAIAPFHTVALNNMAYALDHLNRLAEATQAQGKAVSIEPNYLPYLRSLMGYAAAAGYLRWAVDTYRSLKRKYNHDTSRDKLAVEVYLAIGEPEYALEIEEKGFDSGKDAELARRIKSDMHAKQKSLGIVKKAKESLFSGSAEGALDLLRKAYGKYDSDLALRLNLGLLLAANREYQEAKRLLLSSVTNVSSDMAVPCLLNAAFACMRSDFYEEGTKLIEAAMRELAALAGDGPGAQLHPPSLAYWIDDEGSLEAPYADALQILATAIENSGPHAEVPESVAQLAALYQEFAAEEAQQP